MSLIYFVCVFPVPHLGLNYFRYLCVPGAAFRVDLFPVSIYYSIPVRQFIRLYLAHSGYLDLAQMSLAQPSLAHSETSANILGAVGVGAYLCRMFGTLGFRI